MMSTSYDQRAKIYGKASAFSPHHNGVRIETNMKYNSKSRSKY